MSWKDRVKWFVDKWLIWLFLAGFCVAGVWSLIDQYQWEQAGWHHFHGGWIPPGFVVEVVPEQLNPDGTAARPVQPFRKRPYDWKGGVGTPADYQDDGVDPPPDEVSKSLSKNP